LVADDQAAAMTAAMVQLAAARRALDVAETALAEARGLIVEATVGLARSIQSSRIAGPEMSGEDWPVVTERHGSGRAAS
jgi:hypothetical protein